MPPFLRMCTTPTLRPRRAEQVPSALADGCDPEAGCSAGYPRAFVRLRGRIPMNDMGSLLYAPAHLPLRGREIKNLLPPQGEGWDGGGFPSSLVFDPGPPRCHPPSRAALYFVPPSQGEGTEGGGGRVGRSPARTCAGTFFPGPNPCMASGVRGLGRTQVRPSNSPLTPAHPSALIPHPSASALVLRRVDAYLPIHKPDRPHLERLRRRRAGRAPAGYVEPPLVERALDLVVE
jgi:hypothetical protein